MTRAASNPAQAFASALFDELARCGVTDACICPGSRSTPLAVAAERTRGVRARVHLDERSAGFFALGLARASRRPVALVCTSGTAAANFLPAVVEAHHASVPLLVLTADRPPELRECGAAQTIDQLRLYGPHVRWFAEAPVPEAGPDALRLARALACRAFAESQGVRPGPVHLDLPFREPLEPGEADLAPGSEQALAHGRAGGAPYTQACLGDAAPSDAQVEALVALARAHPRGAIAAGPLDATAAEASAIAAFAQAAGWPVLADPLSQLRCGPHVAGAPIVASADLLLRHAPFAERAAPEAVLRVGAMPTSKALRLWLERTAPAHVALVDPHGEWSDPSRLASHVFRARPAALLGAASERLRAQGRAPRESEWLAAWLAAEARAARALSEAISAEPSLLEPQAARALAEALPEGALLFAASSMPVRDIDAFLPASTRALRVLANRGANGIDGTVSSALGAAAAGAGPTALLTGDLAFLHDAGGLLAARSQGISLVAVVLDNDGGGIFSFLPIAALGERVAFEKLFRTPHGLDLCRVAEAWGARSERIESALHLRTAAKDALAHGGAHVLVVPIDRDRNVAHFRALASAVGRALDAPGEGAP
jgi:2-succinyl-5-enolpyruvyl-6-hydroxy-3-cyclohexene-1-carboxylate synthase